MNIKRNFVAILALAVATSFAQQADNAAAKPATEAKAAPAAKPAPAPAAKPATEAKAAPAAKPAKTKAEAIAEAKEAAAAKKEAKNKSILKADYVDPEVFYGDIADGKKPRGKKTYNEYLQQQKDKQDSIASVNYHHGVTVMGARTNDSRYGDLDDGFVWGGGLGLYYFYRHDFFKFMVLEGRFGGIYRYGRFDNDESAGSKTLSSGKEVDLNINTEIIYHNLALDLPLELKIGGHIEPTTFLFIGFTFGITKSIHEQAPAYKTLDVSSTDKATAQDLDYLTEKGLNKYPLRKGFKYEEHFYMDDWETNGWIGAGIDGKYVSVELQFLVASGSTKDNHRYEHLFKDSNPTWRVMVDFSMR